MLGIVCGLASEAALLRGIPNARIICAGARPQQARWQAREMVKQGVTRLLSFGVAGSLEPGLPAGSLVIGTQVLSMDGSHACNAAWIDRLAQTLPAAHCGPVWGSETVLHSAAAKRAVYERARCLTVDMESQCVAQIAAESGLPFAVLRAVSDASDTEVPPLVDNAIRPDGGVDLPRILKTLLRHPINSGRQIPALIRLGQGTGKALRALKGAVAVLES